MPLASLLRDRFLSLMGKGGEALDWFGNRASIARDAGIENSAHQMPHALIGSQVVGISCLRKRRI